jgi:hypothetical protein
MTFHHYLVFLNIKFPNPSSIFLSFPIKKKQEKSFGQNFPCFGQKKPSFVLKRLDSALRILTFEVLKREAKNKYE